MHGVYLLVGVVVFVALPSYGFVVIEGGYPSRLYIQTQLSSRLENIRLALLYINYIVDGWLRRFRAEIGSS